MPGRALFYKFLTTIIDDLFSFIITMPTMHRISCFRDDIIFVIYIYQRWIYRVDKTRGVYAIEKKEVKADSQLGTEDATQEETPTEATKEDDFVIVQSTQKRKNKKKQVKAEGETKKNK